jgi:hypothetical protein
MTLAAMGILASPRAVLPMLTLLPARALAPAAPDTTIDTKPDLVTDSASASFTFSSNEQGATFECKLDGADKLRWARARDGRGQEDACYDVPPDPHRYRRLWQDAARPRGGQGPGWILPGRGVARGARATLGGGAACRRCSYRLFLL